MQYISAFSGTVLHYILAEKSLSFVCVVLETALSSTVVLNLFYISYLSSNKIPDLPPVH